LPQSHAANELVWLARRTFTGQVSWSRTFDNLPNASIVRSETRGDRIRCWRNRCTEFGVNTPVGFIDNTENANHSHDSNRQLRCRNCEPSLPTPGNVAFDDDPTGWIHGSCLRSNACTDKWWY
jgi:hypothetical protein